MRAAIPFHGGELEARSKWLDFALSRLLDDDTQKAHELAAKLEEQLLPDQEAPTRSGK